MSAKKDPYAGAQEREREAASRRPKPKATPAQRATAKELLRAGWTWQMEEKLTPDEDGHVFLELLPPSGDDLEIQVAVDERGMCLGLLHGREDYTVAETIARGAAHLEQELKALAILGAEPTDPDEREAWLACAVCQGKKGGRDQLCGAHLELRGAPACACGGLVAPCDGSCARYSSAEDVASCAGRCVSSLCEAHFSKGDVEELRREAKAVEELEAYDAETAKLFREDPTSFSPIEAHRTILEGELDRLTDAGIEHYLAVLGKMRKIVV